MTLWDSATTLALASAQVGAASYTANGYAYTDLATRPLLVAGAKYALASAHRHRSS